MIKLDKSSITHIYKEIFKFDSEIRIIDDKWVIISRSSSQKWWLSDRGFWMPVPQRIEKENFNMELKDIKKYYKELEDLLDCGDNSCWFKKKNEHGVYGMRTNGGCRCFRHIDPPKKGRAIDRLVRIVKRAIDEGLLDDEINS